MAAVLMVLATGERAAWAWGREGHRVVARIAARNLTAAAKEKVAAIFSTDAAGVEEAMATAATWPDEIDKKATATRDWHFVTVPVSGPFSIAGACPAHECVLDRITEMADRLRTNAADFALAAPPEPPRPKTSQELAFLIHFVGDVHQPLHAAENGDRGGNCVRLLHPIGHGGGANDFETKELHLAWDVDEVLAVERKLGGEAGTVTALVRRFKKGAAVAQGIPTGWARESNTLARRDVYRKLHIPLQPDPQPPAGACPASAPVADVTQKYLDGNAGDVEARLMAAGIRLSRLINQACAGAGCSSVP